VKRRSQELIRLPFTFISSEKKVSMRKSKFKYNMLCFNDYGRCNIAFALRLYIWILLCMFGWKTWKLWALFHRSLSLSRLLAFHLCVRILSSSNFPYSLWFFPHLSIEIIWQNLFLEISIFSKFWWLIISTYWKLAKVS
jgi:hypothetical protein